MNEAVPLFLSAKYDSVDFVDKGVDGCVYKCVRQGAVTAVKVLATLDSVARARFAREAEILKRFDHPHIVKFLDAGETDGHHWLELGPANLAQLKLLITCCVISITYVSQVL